MTSRSDKIFSKRKALQREELERKKNTKEKRRRILIVTEGEITEPKYFTHLRKLLSLTNVEIDIYGDSGSAPINIVKYAERKAINQGSWQDGGYEQVYCVFDRDTHESFESAKSLVHDLKKSLTFPAKQIDYICSYPCFEFWLLLHFRFLRSAFVKKGRKSPCDLILSELKSITGKTIEKSLSSTFLDDLMGRIDTAVEHAKKCDQDVKNTGELNPSTSIHLIVLDMQKLKREIESEH